MDKIALINQLHIAGHKAMFHGDFGSLIVYFSSGGVRVRAFFMSMCS